MACNGLHILEKNFDIMYKLTEERSYLRMKLFRRLHSQNISTFLSINNYGSCNLMIQPLCSSIQQSILWTLLSCVFHLPLKINILQCRCSLTLKNHFFVLGRPSQLQACNVVLRSIKIYLALSPKINLSSISSINPFDYSGACSVNLPLEWGLWLPWIGWPSLSKWFFS